MASASTVMFTGNVTHKLDPKSRVAVPANWRCAQDGTLKLIDSTYDGYNIVKCYTEASFMEMLADIKEQALSKGAPLGDVNRYLGLITGRSFDAEVSSQGKLLIPKKQRDRLNLGETVTIVGRGPHFELWAPADYEAANSAEALGKHELDKMFRILS